MIFDKLSPTADFISKMQSDLKILNANVLYITHMQDKILKLVNKLVINSKLQKSVDEYFEETSPQTESTGTNTEGID